MNYLTIIRGNDTEVEARANAFLEELPVLKHRVMTVRPFYIQEKDEFVMVIVVNDEPHPHKT